VRGDRTESAASITDRPGNTAEMRQMLLLLLVSAFLLFWGLGTRSLWAAEGRWAEIVREMLLTGDFFHPMIGGEPYFDKPLLTYWFRVLISITTGVLDELVVRLPSAIAGVVAIWATVKIGTRLWSARVGRLAGWLLLTTYAFLFWSRTGTAEAENLAVIILAVAWYWSRRDRLSFPAMLVFYLIVFVGALTKGLTAVVVPIVVVLPDMLVERRWRLLLRPGHLLAFGISLLIYLSPFAYASFTQPSSYESSGLGLVFRENIVRFFRPFDHKGPIYLYLYQLPVLMLPWTPLFLVAVVGIVKGWKGLDRHARWLVWAILLVFLFFTLSGSRRSYYILPILPLCALLMAVFVARIHRRRVDELCRRGLGVQRAVFIGLIAFELALPLILIFPKRMTGLKVPLSLDITGLVIGVVAVSVAVVLGRFTRKPRLSETPVQTIGPLVAIAVVVLAGYFCWQQDILEINRTERPFARQLQREMADLPPERIAIYPKSDANLLFYLGPQKPVGILRSPGEFRGFSELGNPGVLITQRRYAAGLPAEIVASLQRHKSLHEQVHRWESKSSKEEKWVAWFWEDCPALSAAPRANEGGTDAQ
jgi:4-amino-4-deoxy-L-arabinose transferase-like glycosyltransferase